MSERTGIGGEPRSCWRFVGAAVAGLLLVVASPAGAQVVGLESLVVRDLHAPGDGLVTRDLETGLDWLDLTETAGLSVNQVQSGVGGFVTGELDTWRMATGPEVCAMVRYRFYGPGVSPCPTPFSSAGQLSGNSQWIDTAEALIGLLGQTNSGFVNVNGEPSNQPFSAAAGYYDDGDLTDQEADWMSLSVSSTLEIVGQWDGGSVSNYANTSGSFLSTDRTGPWGVYLVRSSAIPEPGTGTLMLVGLALMARGRRPRVS